MTDAAAAVGMDRLPWLEDEPAPRAQPRVHEPKLAKPRRAQGNPRELAGWAVAAGLLVAGASYWLGTQSVDAGPIMTCRRRKRPSGCRKRGQPRQRHRFPIAEVPEVRPAPAPPVKIDRPARNERPTTARRKLTPMEMKGSDLSKTISAAGGRGCQVPAEDRTGGSCSRQACAPAPWPRWRAGSS